MKNLQPHTIDPVECRRQWLEFEDLLKTKSTLSERHDVLPFFKARADLSMIISYYFPSIKNPDRFAHEHQIYGDFIADLVVGDSKTQKYILIEFEDGTPSSIFSKTAKKSTPVWSPRFEGAYSQLVDWLWKLEDMRSTADFEHTFGSRRATFQGLIVLGKDMNLSAQEQDRLKWRLDRTMIDSSAISCVSFNELCDDIDHSLKRYHNV